MNFLDDEAVAGNDEPDASDILVPSSQTDDSIRPRKRRRIAVSCSDESDTSDDDGLELPSNDYSQNDDEIEDPEELEQRSKYEDFMHIPQYGTTQKDTFVTQVTQPWSSPTHIRGPRWRRKEPTPKAQNERPAARHINRSPSCAPRQPPRQPPAMLPVAMPAAATPVVTQAASTTAVTLLAPTEDDFGDDDLDLFDDFMSAEPPDIANQATHAPTGTHTVESRLPAQKLKQTTLFGTQSVQPGVSGPSNRTHNWPLANKTEKPTHHKIDTDAMRTWVYPTNLGNSREYQYNIVHKGLFHNLLVALPTGLGKTFIAATIMLNWYRWTQETQIVFVAPTKPLVAQQIDACFNIAGIPRSQTTLLTGEIQPAIRAEEWQEKRVFFMTPQTLINDLKTGIADPKKIVLLVVDEAHKATGGYAYVEVVKFLQRFNTSFRVLALTATPGSSVESVQQVINGLGISRIEIRTEDSMDIRQYVHQRNENLEVFEYSEEIQEMLDQFRKACQPVQNFLLQHKATWIKDPMENTLYGLKKAQEEWRKSQAGQSAPDSVKWPLAKAFQVMMSLANSVELLKYHGIGPFYHKMKIFDDESYGGGKYAKKIAESQPFKDMMNRLRVWVNNPDFVGHPKLEYLKSVSLNHFMDAGEGRGGAGGRPPSETRIMVFAQYRDSAEEIVRTLKKHEPMIRPQIFVGQAHTKGSEGMDQKKQQDAINQFKADTYKVLVATSIGEEGLDIGEIDLIVCYDASKSPIRMLQRMGRTGRKRAGNVHVLLMKGKEENDFARAKDAYRKMQELIESGKEFIFHEDKSPRIIPKEIQPVVDKRIVEIPPENTQEGSIEPKKRKAKNAKRPPKKFHMPDDVETGFKFLGAGKKTPKEKQSATVARIDETPAPLPSLDQVLLTANQEAELQDEHGEVEGTNTQYTTIPRLDAYPAAFATLRRCGRIKHSEVTFRLAESIKRMRARADDDCHTPSEDEVRRLLQNVPSIQRPTTKSKTASIKTKPKAKKTSGVSSRAKPISRKPTKTTAPKIPTSPGSEDDYTKLGSFIDDASTRDDADDGTDATSPDTLLASLDSHAKRPTAAAEEPYWVSQPDCGTSGDLDEELPNIEDIFGLSVVDAPAKAKKTSAPVRQRRRVVDSDDDD